MAAINFPNSPTLNDTHIVGSLNYVYDGAKWTGGGNSPVDKIYEDDSTVEIVDTGGSSGYFIVSPEGNEAFRVNATGKLLFNNASGSIIGGQSSSGKLTLFGGATNQGGQIDLYGGSNNDGMISFRTGAGAGEQTEKLSIDSSGRLLIGHSSSLNVSGFEPHLQVHGTTAESATITTGRFGDNASAPFFILHKSRGGSIGAHGDLVQNDIVGRLAWYGSDGGDWEEAAHIQCIVDGAVATGGDTTDMPGALIFATTPNGEHNAQERLRIQSDGDLEYRYNDADTSTEVGSTQVPHGLRIYNTNNTLGRLAGIHFSHGGGGTANAGIFHVTTNITTSSTSCLGDLTFYTKNSGVSNMTEKLRITSAGRVGINIDNPESDLHVKRATTGASRIRIQCNGSRNNGEEYAGILFEGNSYSGAKIASHRDDGTWDDRGDLRFYSGYGNDVFTERFRITNTGQHNFKYVNSQAPRTYSNGSHEGLMISVDRDDLNHFLGTVDFAAGRASDNTNGGTQMRFWTQPREANVAAAERLRIASDGDIIYTGLQHDYNNASGAVIQVVNPGVSYTDYTHRSKNFIVQTGTGSATEKLRVDNDGLIHLGNSGHGTTKVGGQSITGQDYSATLKLYDTRANMWGMQMRRDTSTGPNGIFVRAGDSSSNYSLFVCGTNESVTHLACRGDGNVGVGIANPTGNFEVNGNDGINISNATRTGTNGVQWRLIPHNGSGSSTNLRLFEGASNNEVINVTKGGQIGHREASPQAPYELGYADNKGKSNQAGGAELFDLGAVNHHYICEGSAGGGWGSNSTYAWKICGVTGSAPKEIYIIHIAGNSNSPITINSFVDQGDGKVNCYQGGWNQSTFVHSLITPWAP